MEPKILAGHAHSNCGGLPKSNTMIDPETFDRIARAVRLTVVCLFLVAYWYNVFIPAMVGR
jgi:hypothetical protein